jgi:hypothetical protein
MSVTTDKTTARPASPGPDGSGPAAAGAQEAPRQSIDREASERLAARVARCLPGATFELETLARLVGIQATTSIETAAVTCHGRARLLLNPQFIEKHCRRDEHLFLLVMHEMWHVLLGHTTLYGRPTRAHNIAFDAIINAGLTRAHPGSAYRGFFENLNSPHLFPQLLLRAPEGWPNNPIYPKVGPRGTREVLRRLYPAAGRQETEPTYEEIVRLLQQHEDQQAQEGPQGGSAAGQGGQGDGEGDGATLLGDHSHDGTSSPMDDELFADVVRRIVARWPPPPFPLRGRDDGRGLHETWMERKPSYRQTRQAFANIVKEATLPDRKGSRSAARELVRTTVGPGPLPNASDRLLPARRALIGQGALANQQILLPQVRPEPPARALVYLDVSGSMHGILPHIIDLLATPARRGEITVRQFSNGIAPISPAQLAKGKLDTTGGTDIDCVLADVGQRTEKRVLIVTDGYVGTPSERLLEPLVQRGVKLYVALPEDGWDRDLQSIAQIRRLPHITYGS